MISTGSPEMRIGEDAEYKPMTPAQLAEYEARPEVIARRRHLDRAIDYRSDKDADAYIKAIREAEAGEWATFEVRMQDRGNLD